LFGGDIVADDQAVFLVDWLPAGLFNRVCFPMPVQFRVGESNRRPSWPRGVQTEH
jgi:hypothetical protein